MKKPNFLLKHFSRKCNVDFTPVLVLFWRNHSGAFAVLFGI